MRIKKALVSICGALGGLPALAQAPPSDDIRWLDSACVSQHAQACVESVMPRQLVFGVAGCLPGYQATLNAQGNDVFCLREMTSVADAKAFLALAKACETNSRIAYSPSCVRTANLDVFSSELRADLRKILETYCRVFKDGDDKCLRFNGPPPAVH